MFANLIIIILYCLLFVYLFMIGIKHFAVKLSHKREAEPQDEFLDYFKKISKERKKDPHNQIWRNKIR